MPQDFALLPTFQLLGAILGAGATWVTLGGQARSKASLGATFPTNGTSDLRALLVEFFITFLLVFVIIATATDKRVPAALAAPSIGFALVAAVLIGGGASGGAANPDRAIGPMVMSLKFTAFWVYLVGPIAAGVIAALIYEHVIGSSSAPSVALDRESKEEVSAGDRTLATGTDTAQ